MRLIAVITALAIAAPANADPRAIGLRRDSVGRDDDLSAVFRSILDEFRYRYLITYTPAHVAKDGWHKLEVKVNRAGARVKARPGYQAG